MPNPSSSTESASNSEATLIALCRVFGVLSGLMLLAFVSNLPHFNLPLPPAGIPLTLQTLVVILIAIGLGPRFGTLSVLAYLLAGALGAQVFSEGGAGIDVIVGNTGGFLVGFFLAQPVVGMILKHRLRHRWVDLLWIAAAFLAAEVIIFTLGGVVFSLVLETSLQATLEATLYPFIPGEILKLLVALAIAWLIGPFTSRKIW